MGTSNLKRSSFISGMAAALLFLATAQASRADVADEGWGDLGYSKSEAEVEAIPTSIDANAIEPSPEAKSSVTTTYSSSETTVDNEAAARAETRAKVEKSTENQEKHPEKYNRSAIGTSSSKDPSESSSARGFGRISTVRNTYGVLTEENPSTQFYVAPFGGATSITGNTTVSNTARFAVGAQAGLLLTSNLLLGVSYTYSEQNLSAPRNTATNSLSSANDVFALKSNHIEAGAKLFFLGRESRVRPFFGGGFGWGKSYLNYTSANLQALGYQPAYANDYGINQFDSYGELGAEVAITRALVATASFKLRGILSTSTSADSASDAANFDAAKTLVGSSLSRSASYTIGAGLGIYF